MSSPSAILTAAQEHVLAHIANGATHTAAAESAGVHRNTVHNWLNSPVFCQALAQAQYENACHLHDQTKALAKTAIEALCTPWSPTRTRATARASKPPSPSSTASPAPPLTTMSPLPRKCTATCTNLHKPIRNRNPNRLPHPAKTRRPCTILHKPKAN